MSDKLKNAKNSIINKSKLTRDQFLQNPSAFLYPAAAVLGAFLVYKIYKSATSFVKGDTNIDDEIDGVSVNVDNSLKATISKQTAINYASQLLDAMNVMQPVYGTDEDTISDVFDNLKNAADFMLVFDAFGKKDYNGNNSPPTGIWSNLDSYKKQNLVHWLKSELSKSSFIFFENELYEKVKKIINKAGFTF